jgi:hypothetical protein
MVVELVKMLEWFEVFPTPHKLPPETRSVWPTQATHQWSHECGLASPMEGAVLISLPSLLFSPGGRFYHFGDLSRLGNKAHVARFNLSCLSANSFGHESLQIGIDGVILR